VLSERIHACSPVVPLDTGKPGERMQSKAIIPGFAK
jgi:hypothetical protein